MRKKILLWIILLSSIIGALCCKPTLATTDLSTVDSDGDATTCEMRGQMSFRVNDTANIYFCFYKDSGNVFAYKRGAAYGSTLNWYSCGNSPIASGIGGYSIYWNETLQRVWAVWVVNGASTCYLKVGNYSDAAEDFTWTSQIHVATETGTNPTINYPSVCYDPIQNRVWIAYGRYWESIEACKYAAELYRGSPAHNPSSFTDHYGTSTINSYPATTMALGLTYGTIELVWKAGSCNAMRIYSVQITLSSGAVNIYALTNEDDVTNDFKIVFANGLYHCIYRSDFDNKLYYRTKSTGDWSAATSFYDTATSVGFGLYGNSTALHAFLMDGTEIFHRIYDGSWQAWESYYNASIAWDYTLCVSSFKEDQQSYGIVAFTGSSVQAFIHGSSPLAEYTITHSASPEINADFTLDAVEHTTPETLVDVTEGSHTWIADDEVSHDGAYYDFQYWLVNGSATYYSTTMILSINGNTTIIIYYTLKGETPDIPPIFDPQATNATWYFRSDTITTHSILGYKLHEYQSYTATSETRTTSANASVSYGVRIWALDYNGDTDELTSGCPSAIVTRDDNTSGLLSTTWSCSAYNTIIDAVQINIYQRFDNDSWSLRRIFITDEALLIRLPAGTWTFYYHVTQEKGSTNSIFSHGSFSYNTRVILQYYDISVFEKMTYHLQRFQLYSFMVTPWTYWIGDIFYGILLVFFAGTTYLRYQTVRGVLVIFWLFGGVGGFLNALMPAIGLQISWFILAITVAVTIFLLIYGRRS